MQVDPNGADTLNLNILKFNICLSIAQENPHNNINNKNNSNNNNKYAKNNYRGRLNPHITKKNAGICIHYRA